LIFVGGNVNEMDTNKLIQKRRHTASEILITNEKRNEKPRSARSASMAIFPITGTVRKHSPETIPEIQEEVLDIDIKSSASKESLPLWMTNALKPQGSDEVAEDLNDFEMSSNHNTGYRMEENFSERAKKALRRSRELTKMIQEGKFGKVR